LKNCAAILLVFILLLQLCNRAAIVLNFNVNQVFFANNLCVKKAIKNNTCKGKCQLKKLLQKTDDETQGANKSSYENLYVVKIILPCTQQAILYFFKNKFAIFAANSWTNKTHNFVFKPPLALV
jgi:hypothetical protein